MFPYKFTSALMSDLDGMTEVGSMSTYHDPYAFVAPVPRTYYLFVATDPHTAKTAGVIVSGLYSGPDIVKVDIDYGIGDGNIPFTTTGDKLSAYTLLANIVAADVADDNG